MAATPRSGRRMSERPPREGDDPRPRRKKTVKMNPVVAITIFFVIPGIMLGVFIMALVKNQNRDAPEEVVIEKKFDPTKDLKALNMEAHDLYQAAMRLRNAEVEPQLSEARRAFEKGMIRLQEIRSEMDVVYGKYDMLDEYGDLKDEFGAYGGYRSDLSQWLNDLIKSKPSSLTE